MSLFGNKKKELPALFSEAELSAPEVGNYESTLNYLIGLSDDEYAKVCKVADIHRKAYQESAGVLGTPNEPTTFITAPELPEAPKSFLDEPDFLVDDEPAAKPKSRNRKINVKD